MADLTTGQPPAAGPASPAAWRTNAACRETDPDLFFPIGAGLAGRRQAEVAKGVCRSCPVMEQCAAHALAVREPYGVWGGLDERERERQIRREREIRASLRRARPDGAWAVDCPTCGATEDRPCRSRARYLPDPHPSRIAAWAIATTACPHCQAEPTAPCHDHGNALHAQVHLQRETEARRAAA